MPSAFARSKAAAMRASWMAVGMMDSNDVRQILAGRPQSSLHRALSSSAISFYFHINTNLLLLENTNLRDGGKMTALIEAFRRRHRQPSGGAGGRGRSDRTRASLIEGGLTPSLGVATTARRLTRIPVDVRQRGSQATWLIGNTLY
jgi:hypothetical protein